MTLSCEYDLEGGSLYSVKWYKDESEFFRYMPDYDPQNQAFHTPGVTLDVSNRSQLDFINCVLPGAVISWNIDCMSIIIIYVHVETRSAK
jgi:hypothetical protein